MQNGGEADPTAYAHVRIGKCLVQKIDEAPENIHCDLYTKLSLQITSTLRIRQHGYYDDERP
jgi:hypothetical protein